MIQDTLLYNMAHVNYWSKWRLGFNTVPIIVNEEDFMHSWSNTFADKRRIHNQQLNVQGVSQLLKQSDWAQIQDFKWYHNDDYIYW